MKVAVISDIHSNVYALEPVLKDIKSQGIEQLIILGDFFGYYPWALETYSLLDNCNIVGIIKGNHDILLEEEITITDTMPLYYQLAMLNRKELLQNAPEAISWIKGLSCEETITLNGRTIEMYHGSPDDPINGRYYPNNEETYTWFPQEKGILLLGHTHYPLLKELMNGGVVFNPGSVGQPRDGIASSSYGVIDFKRNKFVHRRVKYDVAHVSSLLSQMQWHEYAINLHSPYKK